MWWALKITHTSPTITHSGSNRSSCYLFYPLYTCGITKDFSPATLVEFPFCSVCKVSIIMCALLLPLCVAGLPPVFFLMPLLVSNCEAWFKAEFSGLAILCRDLAPGRS